MSLRADVETDVRRVRERFLCEGSLAADALPSGVLDSWRRSQAMRVHPDRLDSPFVRQPDTGSRLVHAAEPVLRGITQDVTTEAMSVILTSADGVVIERSASEGAFMEALDSVSLAPGYSYAEEFAGTNGIGTALEIGRPVFIRGGEHFVGPLAELACAGAPIRDPITQKIVGIVDLTCWASRSNPVLLPLVKSLGSQIEDRLQESAHASEIALLRAYRDQARRFPLGVLAIGGDVLLMNRFLRQTLDINDQIALLEHASDLLHTTATRQPLAVLPSGTTANISVVDHAEVRGRTNVVFHVHLPTEATASRVGIRQSVASHVPGLVGRSSAWRRSCEQVERCCRDRDWVLLEGERGSGRAKLAQAVAQYVHPTKTVRVIRAETISTPALFVAEIVTQTDGDDFAAVISDVDCIDEGTLAAVVPVLQSRASRGWIAATMSSSAPSPKVELLLPLFTHTVAVPALRHRIEDIEVLVPFLLRELTSGADVRLGADAMRQLSKLPWPGNVAQLRRVVAETVARQRSGVIGADKLPPECRSLAKRKLTQLEALERDAIVRSLEDNANNKLQAAIALGMSRATIYRKMRDYGIA
ncbi:siderophore-interacting protein [Mycobacterium triplex]|uniref:Siderophore-interacting protein n=2 Tax=Mycobacterium triplex TaxID=47839 RepID=A0ABX3VW29_9MYCO|nr:helix-turn-helix domain-containing protein [Mycobacterium triplex]ORW99585.1 siderophore-interacting protein [Mycobacterium triplex]